MSTTLRCPRCRSTWTGTSACHCAGCHRTFTGTVAFDRHRRLTGEHGRCVDPATVGLVKRDRGWGQPGSHPERRAA